MILQFYFSAKKKEIEAGVDGFMVYDLGLLKPAQKVACDLCW